MENHKLGYAVYENIFDSICKGNLQSGDKLPSAQKISRDLSLSIVSVREAIQGLAAIGFLEIIHGKGIFVTKGDSILDEIFEARKVMECMNVELAVKKISTEQIEILKGETNKMETALNNGDLKLFREGDHTFHSIIAEASKNRFVRKAYENTKNFIFSQISTVHEYPGNPDMACLHHRKILNALEKKDAAQARKEMQVHLDMAHEVALKVIASQQH